MWDEYVKINIVLNGVSFTYAKQGNNEGGRVE